MRDIEDLTTELRAITSLMNEFSTRMQQGEDVDKQALTTLRARMRQLTAEAREPGMIEFVPEWLMNFLDAGTKELSRQLGDYEGAAGEIIDGRFSDIALRLFKYAGYVEEHAGVVEVGLIENGKHVPMGRAETAFMAIQDASKHSGYSKLAAIAKEKFEKTGEYP